MIPQVEMMMGFSGKYSYLRKERDDLVIADIKGSGVINRYGHQHF
jgi:hypothetical protein